MDYWARVRQRAKELGADGCTVVPEFYHHCCNEHDIHYRTHKTLDGEPITRAEADKRLRDCIIQSSMLHRFSPMAWWRWAAVRAFAFHAWNKNNLPPGS